MSAAPPRGRRVSRVAALAVAGVVLASCGTLATPRPLVTGVPSSSIAVPLGLVACTPSATCVALGGSSVDVGPTSTGEYRRPDGVWIALPVPGLAGASLSSASCWADGCLVAGTSASGDLVWRFHAGSHAMTPSPAPEGGAGITAVSCARDATCVALDTSPSSGLARLLVTIDGGASWTAPAPLAWSRGLAPTALACTGVTTCLVAATRTAGFAGEGAVVLEITRDAGVTWTPRPTPTGWRSLTSLSCDAASCVGVATTPRGTLLARTSNRGARWRTLDPHVTVASVDCTAAGACVVAGQDAQHRPWLATWRAGALTAARLRYVPSAPVAVACGRRTCAAVAVSTLMSLVP